MAEAEKVVGWAKNHYLSTCTQPPSIKGERLCLPRERYVSINWQVCACLLATMCMYALCIHKKHKGFICLYMHNKHQGFRQMIFTFLHFMWSLELAVLRLKEQETLSRKPAQNLKACNSFPFSYKNYWHLNCNFNTEFTSWKFCRTLQRASMKTTLFQQWYHLVKLVSNSMILVHLKMWKKRWMNLLFFQWGGLNFFLTEIYCGYLIFCISVDANRNWRSFATCNCVKLFSALQRNITFWSSWNWEDPSC